GGNGAQYTGYTYLLNTRNVQSDSVFTGLSAQGYQLTVRDARGCEITRSLSLTQPLQSLQLSVSDLKDTKCFNDSTGQITLAASGGVQPFTYRIGQESFVSSNIYPKLPVGKYNFTAKDVNGCTIVIDTVVRHILPTPSIALVPQEISCYGHEDGQVSASLSGGSGSFAYRWYRRNNGSWNDLNNTSSLISQLAPGDYRLQATDKAGCPSIYDSTTVVQVVTPLVIDNVTLHDIRCFGDNGSIDIQASGSNGGYIYQYSKNNGVFQNYNSGNPLPYASYNLRVVDAKGCTTDWPYVQTITTPLQPLGLTYTLKDYNGYNVSCFGNDDGRLAVKPTGGNGSNYSGYTYALSGRTVQTDTVFDKLTAGNYNLTLTDARGCSFLQPVTLTQALSEVKLWASLIDPATCHYDSNGKITLAALGGKSPYTFRLENGSYQEANQFSGLKVGSYHLTVRDKNGCQQFMDTTVDYAIPKIEITGTISPVKCFGQDNGAITTGVSGGALPYAYYWKENARTSSDIDKLFKGSYTLSVTDAAGCIEEKEFQVKEPALPLSVTATSLSACAETQNGVVRPVALGGTPPYFYSVESFSKTTTGKEILVYDGTYTVFATDSNHCEASTKVIVQKRNDMPLPNFMVATSRYSLDTLVIKDVSVPKPDSITWEFSPEAKVIGYEQFEPKIKYEGAGAYSVKMIGHFGSCDYSVDKLISIAPFDPTIKERDNYQRGVQSIELSPNPNNGQFKVKIALYNKEQVQLKVLDIWGKQWHSASFPACLDIETDIRLDNPISGTYVLWVVTDTDAKAIRFVISR
ncbi:MAG TPA: SprB repeat-containing protein, partial [Bacteroidales bacterium]|nr:SprB repeat-containing protein [Bacteroidales bacterium]